MASNRCAYKLLSAIADYREQEKDVPEDVSKALGTVESSLHGAMQSKGPEPSGSDSSFESAKEGAREKYRESMKDE